MTHYDRIDLIGDNMMLVDVDCETCDDGGPTDDCTCCAGMDVVFYDLTTLLHNIAMAGALCEAYNQRVHREFKLRNYGWRPGCGTSWSNE